MPILDSLLGLLIHVNALQLHQRHTFQTYHKEVRSSVAGPYKGKSMAQIRADADWMLLVKGRPPVWEKMNGADKAAFRQLMDTMYPPVASKSP